jgi:hypothetical protein
MQLKQIITLNIAYSIQLEILQNPFLNPNQKILMVAQHIQHTSQAKYAKSNSAPA